MTGVLIGIRPEGCKKIVSSKKTIEVQKTRPKLKTPFKCYIYCTFGKRKLKSVQNGEILFDREGMCAGYEKYKKLYFEYSYPDASQYSGSVICEFVCDKITEIYAKQPSDNLDFISTHSCLSPYEICKYAGKKEFIYGWHISNLKIYDKPKELSEFYKVCEYREDGLCEGYRKIACPYQNFDHNPWPDLSLNVVKCDGGFKLRKPPQSWCYVEEIDITNENL